MNRAQPTIPERIADLPADVGSGYWLRAFGAARSVAVPIRDERGSVRGVLSVALRDTTLDDQAVADRLRASAQDSGAVW